MCWFRLLEDMAEEQMTQSVERYPGERYGREKSRKARDKGTGMK